MDSAITALLETVNDRTGLDFRDYAPSSLHRRIERRVVAEHVGSVAALHALVEAEPAALARLAEALTVPVTSMFRDPAFFREFRAHVAPLLRTHPFLRLWVAGCSTGQEVYSLAIALHEEGLYERSRIYATELQPATLDQAASGIYPLASMQEYTRNYQEAGGTADFSDYYFADASSAIMRPHLRNNVVFAVHNLVSDRSFNEFHLIFCRNVMIYFNRPLQQRVHDLLYDSLALWGYLGLGRSESVRFSRHEHRYEPVSERERLYRKIL
ncbi:MAG TPA: protein-glutamate O-methyltransferase CheR [Steroidobacteraceae bacterium]|nr:protein-glutamate O-methyltransferase CheR [Steroidobacteraceae bacterium]